ncbi:MAG: glycoside hydrolase family 2 TIM barrel-domain containing protein, partial [Planctomycetota bacterium]
MLACATTLAGRAVELVRTEAEYTLMRDEQRLYLKGAGGDGDLALLKRAGGNAIRTWGVGPETPAVLDDAHANGLVVVFGLWLGHERHGFDYNDAGQVADQLDAIRAAVETYKDHPAIIAWSIGNEMEGYEDANNAAIWSHVQSAAGIVKDLDPTRPTMTVIADVGGGRVPNIHRLCPDIDIVGINSYGGAPSIPQRYRDAVPEG